MFRSDKTGCRVGRSLIFSTGVNEIRDSWPKVNGMWDTQGPPPLPPNGASVICGLGRLFMSLNTILKTETFLV